MLADEYEVSFIYEGRLFTRYDLLKAVVAVSGNKAQGLALVWEHKPLYTTIELIEAVADSKQQIDEDEDLW